MKLYQVAYELVGKLSSSFNTSMFSASESLQGLNNKLKDINSAQKNITGFAKLEEDARKTSVALSEARKKFAELNNEIKASGTPTKQQSQNLETARLKVENLSNKLGSQRQKLSEVRNELKNAGINYKNLSAENERLAQSTLKAQKAQEKLRNVLSKRQQLEDSFASLKGKAIGAAATAGSAILPLKAYAEAENAAVQLKVAMMDSSGAVGENYQKLVKLANELGNKLPGTTAEFQEMMTTLKTQGISDTAILNGVGKATAYLGVMLKKTSSDAALFTAKLQDATKTSEKDMLGLADTIQRAFYLGVDSENMLSFFSKVSPVMDMVKKSGLDFANTFAPMAVMLDQAGMRGEAAGNAMRKVFQAGFDVNKMKKANKEFKTTLNFLTKEGEFAGLENFYKQLDKLKKLSTSDRVMYLKKAFGDDAETQQLIAVLMSKGSDGYKEVVEKIQKQADLQKRIDAQLGTLSNTWEAFTGTMTNVLATMGEPIANIIRPELDKINNYISNTIAPWMEKNKELVATIAKVGLSLVALKVATFAVSAAWMYSKGVVLSVQATYLALRSSAILATVATKGWAAAQWLFNAAMTANPIGLIVAAIAAVIAAGVALYMHWDTVKAKFVEVWEGIKNWFTSFSLYDSGMKMLQTLTDGIKAAAYAPVEAIGEVLGKVREYLPFSDAKVGPLSQLTLSGQKVVDTLREGMLSANPLTDDISKQLEIANSVNTIQMSQQGINIPSQRDNSQNGIISSLMTKLSNIDLSNVIPKFDNIIPSFESPLGFNGLNSLDLSGLSGGSTTSMNVTYAPVINIQGTGNQQDINQAIKDGNDDFIKKLKASQEQNRRLSYV